MAKIIVTILLACKKSLQKIAHALLHSQSFLQIFNKRPPRNNKLEGTQYKIPIGQI